MKQFCTVLGVLLAVLALIGWLVLAQGVTEPLVPDPENVVQKFTNSLATGRYEIAAQALSSDLQSQESMSRLERLDKALQTRYGNYKATPGGETQTAGEQASYQLPLKTTEGGTLHPTFALARNPETGEWEITSFGEMEMLVSQ